MGLTAWKLQKVFCLSCNKQKLHMNSDPLVAHDKKETFKKTKYTVTRVQVEKLLKSFEVTTTFNSPHPFVMLLDVAPCLESSRVSIRKNEKPQEDYYAGSKVSVCGNDPPGDSFSRRWIVFFVAERVPLKGQQHLICIGPK